VTPTNAYDELSGLRLDVGRGYDRRSVETFRARALGIVDDLLRRVTELEDRLAAGGGPSLFEPETDLVNAFRSNPDHETLAGSELDEWLQSFNAAASEPEVVEVAEVAELVDLVGAEPQPRLPLRVAAVEGSSDAPTQPTPWAGWVD
jgi:hypothetical protein